MRESFRRTVSVHPRDDSTCGWTQILEPLGPARRWSGRGEVDCAIVGAGFTGFAIARRLSELRPEWRTVVLEAQRVGSGTSGRASGFVVDLTDAAARMKPEARGRYVSLAKDGIDHLRGLVHEYGIDCDWDETGWLRAAAGDEGQRYLDDLPALYGELGMAYQRLDSAAMTEVTGTKFYRHGIRLPGYPLVQAGALVRGLARACPESVELYEESPVTEIEGHGSQAFRLTVGEGSLTARKLFLATNGYTPFLGFLSRRVFPLYTFGSLTRPLADGEQRALGGETQWGILAMDPMGSTVRRTADQRILIRNWVYYNKQLQVSEDVRQRILKRHREAFLARFPMLADVEFEYTWGGLMGSSHNSQLSFEELKPNLYIAGTYTAAGIAMSHTAGRLLVDYALGLDTREVRDILSLPKPTWMPPEPFRSIGGGWLAERMNTKPGAYL